MRRCWRTPGESGEWRVPAWQEIFESVGVNIKGSLEQGIKNLRGVIDAVIASLAHHQMAGSVELLKNLGSIAIGDREMLRHVEVLMSRISLKLLKQIRPRSAFCSGTYGMRTTVGDQLN